MTSSVDPSRHDCPRMDSCPPESAPRRVHMIRRPGTGKNLVHEPLVLQDLFRRHDSVVFELPADVLGKSGLQAGSSEHA